MSVSDPLLKTLKKAIIGLCVVDDAVSREVINDDHLYLRPLCEAIEEVLRKGLYRVGGFLNLELRDYWHWMVDLPKLIKQDLLIGSKQSQIYSRYEECINIVKSQSTRVETPQGKGRLLIRALLQYKILHWPIECLCFSLNDVNHFYSEFNSLLGNEILSHMLISQLSQLSVLSFKLNLVNCIFLDETWMIPVYKMHEFVPCKQLGVNLIAIDAYQVVEAVKKGGVAEEDHLLEPGDVLDQLFDYSLKWCKLPLRDLMKSNEKKPVRLSVIKFHMSDGSAFPPILKLLKKSDLLHITESNKVNISIMPNSSLPVHARLNEFFPDDVPATNPNMAPQYGLRYVGSTYIGSYGGVSKIESSIAETLKHYNDPISYAPVYIELGEKDLIVRKALINIKEGRQPCEDLDVSGDEIDSSPAGPLPVLFIHAYPQISSCGRRIDCTRFLAYIVGESTCTISKHFVCHVYEARNEYESKTVLCSIAQGFERTHWAI